jgi:hypothetical protein
MKAQIAEFGKDYRTGMWRVTFSLFGDFRQAYDELHEGFVDLTVKKYRKKRSRNANAYCWELIGQLADKLDIPPLEIYRDAIREVGVYQDVEIAPKAAETFAHIWRQHGLGWVCEKLDEMSGPNDMIVMRFWYGSSSYNTKQMSRLIDCIVTECREQGIETATPEELSRYLDTWRASV